MNDTAQRNLRNATILAHVAREAVTGEDAVDKPGDAFIFGFMVGVMLAETAPNTARGVRQRIETIVTLAGQSPEQVEVQLRDVAGLFDLTADAEA